MSHSLHRPMSNELSECYLMASGWVRVSPNEWQKSGFGLATLAGAVGRQIFDDYERARIFIAAAPDAWLVELRDLFRERTSRYPLAAVSSEYSTQESRLEVADVVGRQLTNLREHTK